MKPASYSSYRYWVGIALVLFPSLLAAYYGQTGGTLEGGLARLASVLGIVAAAITIVRFVQEIVLPHRHKQ